MPTPFILIDGYNLMHAMGTMRVGYGPGEFERQRMWFLKSISRNLSDRERERTTVVFDAPATSRGGVAESRVAGLTVVYAQSELEADDVLEELIAGHSAPKQILLVSSDHRLQRAARRRRGKFTDSEDFAALLEKREQRNEQTELVEPTAEEIRKQSGLQSPTEVAAWVKVFGDIPEVEEVKRLAPPEIDIEALQREIDRE